jgi:hypothetical protein
MSGHGRARMAADWGVSMTDITSRPAGAHTDTGKTVETSADGERFILLGNPGGREAIAKRIHKTGWSSFFSWRSAAGFTPSIAISKTVSEERSDD